MDKRQSAVIARLNDYKKVFSTPEGKRVLADLAKKAGLLATNYVPNDPHGTSYNEGARSIVLHIFKSTKTDITNLTSRILEAEEDADTGEIIL